jgi:hypothetical protein
MSKDYLKPWRMFCRQSLKLLNEAIFPVMSSWEDHEEMIDDQYLMESIEEDQKLADGVIDVHVEDFEDEK